MKVLHYNCTSGICGDMNLSALIDIGVDEKKLVAELKKLNVDGWNISSIRAQKNGIWGTQVLVDCLGGTLDSSNSDLEDDCECKGSHGHEHDHDNSHKHHHCCCEANPHSHHENLHDHHCCQEHTHHHNHHHGRSFSEIKTLILSSSLSDFVKDKSIKIFGKLAEAEAFIHNKSVDDIHFHEVGAVDSIIDIIGSVICLDILGVDKITVGGVELGGGFVKCEHGTMPVPAPATAVLANGFICSVGGVNHEATTPTGMAFLAALAENSTSAPTGKILARGIGIGKRDCAERANIIQVLLIDDTQQSSLEKMNLISANIDDMTAESLSHLCSKLFEAGCVDVWQESIAMKKSRIGVKVEALVGDENLNVVEQVFFNNSTTLGVRITEVYRKVLPRECVRFNSSLGDVRIKFSGEKIKAEFDDVSRIANSAKISFVSAKERIETEFKNRQS